ncbi:MAG TPA: SPFH domain-containing protein [Polyangiales bacterium]|nr:SPFH domain-containing protein [Polyangiales bacterium]
MGIFNKLKNELIDIVEWIDDSQRTLVWRFPRYQNEIKDGARLIVRPGQVAVFVDQGKIADVFEPGSYELETDNLPILSTLRGWKHGFRSPFKCEVYFVSTRTLTDLKWGTPNPIMLRDPEFGPVRLRAFGNYTLRAIDPKALLKELVGTDGIFESDQISELLRSVIASSFADVLGEAQIAALDLASKYGELAEKLRKKVNEGIDDEYGLEVPQLQIVNIALPESVEKAIDTRSQMGVIGDMQRYQQFQVGNAITQAAQNPGGGAAATGVGLGVGFAMANQVAQGLNFGGGAGAGVQPPAAPPPPPAASSWHITQNGQSLGPFNQQQLAQGVQQGQVNAQTLVWSAGMTAWTPAGQVPQLAGLFGPPPPPPPPVPPKS